MNKGKTEEDLYNSAVTSNFSEFSEYDVPPVPQIFEDTNMIIEDGDPFTIGTTSDDTSSSNINTNVINNTTSAINNITKIEPQSLCLQEKLKTLAAAFNSMESFNLSIRRRCIYSDTVQKLKRAFKNGVIPFSVTFIGGTR